MFNDLTLYEVYNRETPFESLVPGTGIVLIGTAAMGPSMVPVKVNSIQDALMTFGVSSELANAYMEATLSGATNVYLVRINGTHAETNIQDMIMLHSLEAIDSANVLQYEIITSGLERYLTLTNPMTGYNSSYYLTGKTISQIVSEINVDAVTFQAPVYATAIVEGSTSTLQDEYFSDAQTDGADSQPGTIDPARITEILSYLDFAPIGQVGILCYPFNGIYDGDYVYSRITEFTERKTKACMPCMVTIGVDEFLVSSHNVYAAADAFKDRIKLECPVSEFINIILARPVFSTLYYDYVSNGVAAYCGLIDSASYYEGTTNKRMFGATQDEVSLTASQKTDLANVGYVVLTDGIYNGEQQVRVLRGVNLSKDSTGVVDLNNSGTYTRYIPAPLSNIANVKLVQHIVYQLNDVLQAEELTKISTLRARLVEVLEAEAEYIKEYNIDIGETYQGYARTYIVGVEITPVGELSSITLTMQTR